MSPLLFFAHHETSSISSALTFSHSYGLGILSGSLFQRESCGCLHARGDECRALSRSCLYFVADIEACACAGFDLARLCASRRTGIILELGATCFAMRAQRGSRVTRLACLPWHIALASVCFPLEIPREMERMRDHSGKGNLQKKNSCKTAALPVYHVIIQSITSSLV